MYSFNSYNITDVSHVDTPIGVVMVPKGSFVEVKLYTINDAGQRIERKVMLVPASSDDEVNKCGH